MEIIYIDLKLLSKLWFLLNSSLPVFMKFNNCDFRRIKKKYFHLWRFYPEYVKIVQEREKRRLEMRRKVASILPDFEGSSSIKVDESM